MFLFRPRSSACGWMAFLRHRAQWLANFLFSVYYSHICSSLFLFVYLRWHTVLETDHVLTAKRPHVFHETSMCVCACVNVRGWGGVSKFVVPNRPLPGFCNAEAAKNAHKNPLVNPPRETLKSPAGAMGHLTRQSAGCDTGGSFRPPPIATRPRRQSFSPWAFDLMQHSEVV
jgi:hypothetical protein